MAFADAFEALFLMADVDRDGRVSGAEAINFFRAAADLPQPTLAKVWEFACKGQAGFLTRQEFYNALKLATVAQTGKELTSELVKAALIGPAAAQIPPPRMISAAPMAPPPHNSAKFLVESSQAGTSTTTGEPQPHPMPLQANFNGQQYNSSRAQSGTATPDLSFSQIHQHYASPTRQLSTSHDLLGSVAMWQNEDAPQTDVDSDVVSSVGSDAPVKVGGLNQAGISSCGYDGRQQLAGAAAPPTSNSPWPKMAPTDVQRFVNVFRQLDTDHDGKVTGEQARQLFLSWQLPREVLRHVWNLSDEDGDCMLSVREFCTAVYLLERFTEGWPMPSSLPKGIHLDEPPNVIPVGKKDCVGQSSVQAVLDCALSSKSSKLLQSPGEVASIEKASCWPHNSQTLQKNAQCIKQHRVSKDQTLTPTVTEPVELVPTKKEKAEYYRSKLQEIVHFKSQCENKLAEMTEKVIVFKNEVNALSQQYHEKLKSASDLETEIAAQRSTVKHIQEKERELSGALLKLDCDSSQAPESNLQTRFDHLALDLHKLKKMLLIKAKSLDVDIKRKLITKAAFGWQPNIQEKAAEWKKGWGSTFNDEGFVEVEESHINPTSEVALVAISGAISPEEACSAAAADGNVEPGQNALDLDIVDCRLGHLNVVPPAHEEQPGSAKESPKAAASSVSVAINSESTKQTMQLPVSDHKPRSMINEFSAITDESGVHSNSNQPPIAAVGTVTRDALHVIHSGIGMEAAIETLGAKPHLRAESMSSEVIGSITSDALRGKWDRMMTNQKLGQNDGKSGSSIRASWELQSSNSRNRIQSPAETNASRRELRSRGSFEPEDYFDLSPPRDLKMPAPSSGGPATLKHDTLETVGFLAYTIKESSGSSPVFTTSTKPPFETLIQTHPGPEKYHREE